MNYLDLNIIKKQCRVDADFTGDDEILSLYGDSAESFLEAHLNCALDDICAENGGELPPSLKSAMLLYVDYLYNESGSAQNYDLPQAYWILVNPYKTYSIA